MSRAPRPRAPRFSLFDIQTLVRAGRVHVYKGRAVNEVVKTRKCTVTRAIRFACSAVLDLTPGDFVDFVTLVDGRCADEYAIALDELSWYVKVTINVDDGEAEILSCHLPEYDLKTIGGTVVLAAR